MSKYTAFISYRHLEPDAEIARKLHTQIENFGIPKAIKKQTGRKNTGRVFRDQDELPLSSDLGEDIRRALEESEWLICVCSPQYRKSKWCMEELRYFISLGRRDRVLAVLTEGEPEDSFPELLRFQTVDGVTAEKEPLAADVRAADTAGMLKSLRREKLRIIAPILGVDYDDLRQRARRRRARIAGSAAAAAIVLLSGFLAFALTKNAQISRQNEEITAQRNDALTAESRWLAQSAEEALQGGDRMLALLLSLEALPKDPEAPERPLTEEAVSALRSAVISGGGDVIYQPVAAVTVPGLEEYRGTGDALLCFSRKTEGFISAYDLKNGEEGEPPYTLTEEPTYFLFANGGAGYCVYDDRITRSNGYLNDLSLTDGIEREHFVRKEGHVWGDYYKFASNGPSSMVLMQKNTGVLSRYYTHASAYREYPDEREGEKFGFADVTPISGQTGNREAYFVLAGRPLSNKGPAMLLVNIGGYGSGDNIARRYYLDASQYSYPLMIDASCDGGLIAGATTDHLYFWNAEQEDMVSVFSMKPRYGFVDVRKIAFSPVDPFSLCVLTGNGRAFLYDCASGSISLDLEAGTFRFTDFMWNADGSRLLLTCSDDKARIYTAADGKAAQTLGFEGTLEKASFAEEDSFGNSASDRYIILKGGERVQIYVMANTENVQESAAVAILKDYTHTLEQGASQDEDPLDRIDLSADGKTIWNMRKDGLYVLDAQSLETLKVFREDFGSSVRVNADRQSAQSVTESMNGRLIITDDLVFVATKGTVHVYDPKTLERLTVLRGSYPHFYHPSNKDKEPEDRSETSGLANAAVSKDGKYILASSEHPGWYGFQWDPSVFVYRRDGFEELWHTGLDSGDTGRVFDFARDWEGYVSIKSRFIGSGEKTLVIYVYDPHGSYPDYDRYRLFPREMLHLAFEVRNSKTGAVEETYHLPYEVDEFWTAEEYGLIAAQDSGNTVHVIDMASGAEIAAIERHDPVLSVEAEEDRLKILYQIKETDSVSGTASEVLFREGKAREVKTEELFPVWPRPDGVFAGEPFLAKADGLYSAESGKTIINWHEDDYIFLRAWDDGSRVLCFMPFAAEDSGSKDFRKGSVAVIHDLPCGELQKIALRVLNGRELTDEQKEKYFLK